jgi:predicted NBD/HSP70 family sugar kinase
MFASSRSLIRYYAELEPKATQVTIMEMLKLAEDGDASAMKALTRQARFIAEGLRIITTALSPEVIFLTGGLTSSWMRFGPIIAKELSTGMLAGDPPRLAVTSDVELARLRGAAARVLQRHSGYHRGGDGGRKSRKRKS